MSSLRLLDWGSPQGEKSDVEKEHVGGFDRMVERAEGQRVNRRPAG